MGEGAASQGAFTGVFQNRFMPSANAIWTKGKHTITFGGSWSYTQLNTRDNRTDQGMIGFADFSQFLEGIVTPYSVNGFVATTFLTGNANRYYRANETGEYLQDKFQLRPNLSVTFGLRWDYDGGSEREERRDLQFRSVEVRLRPDYRHSAISNGFVIAGNNKLFPTKGVSNSTSDRTAMGTCASARRRLEPGQVQQQTRGTRRMGHLLRSRRAVYVSLTRLRGRRDSRRTVRRESGSAIRGFAELLTRPPAVPILHPQLQSR